MFSLVTLLHANAYVTVSCKTIQRLWYMVNKYLSLYRQFGLVWGPQHALGKGCFSLYTNM